MPSIPLIYDAGMVPPGQTFTTYVVNRATQAVVQTAIAMTETTVSTGSLSLSSYTGYCTAATASSSFSFSDSQNAFNRIGYFETDGNGNLIDVSQQTTAAQQEANAAAANPTIVHAGTLSAGGTTSITLDSGASTTANIYAGRWIYFNGGTGAGQYACINAYSTGRVATLDRTLATATGNTTVFSIGVPSVQVEA